MRQLMIVTTIVLVSSTVAHSDLQTKKPQKTDVGLYQGTENYAPFIHAALMIDKFQRAKIDLARAQIFLTDEVIIANDTIKGDPNATPEQKEAAFKVLAQAESKLRDRVAEILTSDQKAWIEKINRAFDEAIDTTDLNFKNRFVDKSDVAGAIRLQEERDVFFKAELARRLETVLSPEQKAAVERASNEATKKKDGK